MNGEMPKPHGYLFERCEFMYPNLLDKEVIDDPTTLAVYTADQMRAFAQEATRQAMERCAAMCDAKYQVRSAQGFPREASTARSLRDAIRALSDVAAQEGKVQIDEDFRPGNFPEGAGMWREK